MNNSIKIRVMFLLFIGFSSNSAMAVENEISRGKSSLKQTAASSREVCSNIVKVWRDQASGRLQSETVDASSKAWGDVVRQSSSPEDVCKAVAKRVKYSRDMFAEDEWRSGKDTWDKKEGDCEDYAATVKDICVENSFKADIYIVKSGTADASHAVAIGTKDGGTLWMSSNGSYVEVRSLDEAKEKIARDFGWWVPDVTIYKVEASAGKRGRNEV